MDLHRTTGKPDWVAVAPQQQNIWQRYAARTNGWLTPSNAITVLGLVIVLGGLIAIGRHHYWYGIASVVIGRLCDLLDGWLAERTGTKSPLGEMFDVVADKITVAATLITFFVAHTAAWWILAAMLAPHLIITITTAVAYRQHIALHPSRLGKLSMAAVWVCLTAFLVIQAVSGSHNVAVAIVDALALLTAAAGLYAAGLYAVQRG